MGQLGAGPLTLALALAAAGGPLAAQQPTQAPPVFRTDVQLVRLLATVKDFDGAVIGNVDRKDFVVEDNGVRQEISVFERYTEQPLSIAILLDTSASIAKDLRIALESVKRFLAAAVKEGNPADEIALFTFNHEVNQHTGFTRRFSQIERSIQPLRAEAGTSLYDAIYFGARSLDDRDGRHVIVVVTDGGDTTSGYSYHNALEAAHRADAPIYSILLMPILNDAGRNIGGENALTTLGQSTGGRLFLATVGSVLDDALADILHDLRTQYLLGYYPTNIPRTTNRFHTLRVEVNRPNLRVSTRTGYYEDSTRDSRNP